MQLIEDAIGLQMVHSRIRFYAMRPSQMQKFSHYSLPVTIYASDRTQLADIGKSLRREVDIKKLLYALSDLGRKT